MNQITFAQNQPNGQSVNASRNWDGLDDSTSAHYALLISLAELDLQLAKDATDAGVTADLMFPRSRPGVALHP